MDLITQGALGAAFAQSSRTETRHVIAAGACGFLAGMAPDLDALIRSGEDPLIFLEYHRHFTHSLAFIPVGGLISALCLYGLAARRWQLTFWQVFLFCTLGYATHGLLDAATSYGTSLLWPFSQARMSWSLVSIVDPLFTLPLIAGVVLALVERRPMFARLGLLWCAVYLTTAFVQHRAALEVATALAAERGHTPFPVQAKPSFGNTLVWRTIYEFDGAFYIDAARVGVAPRVFVGTSLPKLVPERDLPWLRPGDQQARDIERFRFFSLGLIAQSPDDPNRIVDIRYSFVPNEVRALWSIDVSPNAPDDAHVVYRTHREDARENLATLWRMIVGD